MKEERCYSCMKMKEVGSICPHCGADNDVHNEDHQLPAGTILKEQYLIGKVLGQGGFGITYIGWDRYLEIPVAIKEYFPSGAVSRNCRTSTDVISGSGEVGARFRNSRERFMREVKMLARLSDIPEIVQVKTFFLENNTAYIVMEYIEGITLKEYTEEKGGRLDYQETRKLLGPVIKALEKVHKAGVVHRDISPDNIMIQKDGRVKLLDFGAVRDVGLVSPDKPLSQSTEAILKQGYAPVEQYQNKGTLGPWTDVYAMCATIYFCLMGEVPTDAPGRMLGDPLKWFEDEFAEIPAEASRTLEKGMALRVQDRIQSMSELYQGLYEEAPDPDPDQNPDPDPDPNPDPDPDPEKPRSLLWKAVVAGLLVISAAAGIRAVTENVFSPGNEEKQVVPVQDKEPALTSEPTVTPEPEIQSGECGENLHYELNCDTGVLTLTALEGQEGIMTDFCDDEGHQGEPRCPWEDQRELIQKLVITENVAVLGEIAFDGCVNLTEVEGIGNVKEIHTRAFRNCSGIRDAGLADGLRYIGPCAFEGCTNLTEMVIPASVEEIGQGAFYQTPLKKINFEGNPVLDEDMEYGDVMLNVFSDVEGDTPENLCIYGLTGSEAENLALEYKIPFVSIGYVEGFVLEGQCGDDVFWNLDYDTGVLTLTGSGSTWFYLGSMERDVNDDRIDGWPEWHNYVRHVKKLVMEPEITELGDSLFEDCLELNEIEWGNVERVNTHVFSTTGLISIVFPDSLKYIGNYCADGNSKLEEVVIPKGVTEICEGAFVGCDSLKKVTILGSPYLSVDVQDDGSVTAFECPDWEISPDLVLYGREDSSVKSFAAENGIPFAPLE